MNSNIKIALIIAAAIVFYVFAGRYELTGTPEKRLVWRLNKLTGSVSACVFRGETSECRQLPEW